MTDKSLTIHTFSIHHNKEKELHFSTIMTDNTLKTTGQYNTN